MQAGGYKTKLFTPAIAGTQHPAGVGDQPGRLGEGRNRIHRAASTIDIRTANIHPGTKKRRMRCIVVSGLPALFQRPMLIGYQIGVDFAFGMVLKNVGEVHSGASSACKMEPLDTKRTVPTDQMRYSLFRIRPTYISVGTGGRGSPPLHGNCV